MHTEFRRANLSGASLQRAMARFASFSSCRLQQADLRGADLRGGSLRRAKLQGADLRDTVLRFTSMVEAEVEGANFSGAQIYGIGAWNLKGEPADQSDLVYQVNSRAAPMRVHDLDTSQLLSLFLDNPRIADVIDTASKHTVLILGRFTPRRKRVLDALRQPLLQRDLVPVMFDFQGPRGRDLTETIAALAHMACFVVADLSESKSVPQELSFIVPYLPSVPVAPILQQRDRGYPLFEHLQRYPWVLAPLEYRDLDDLLARFDDELLRPAYQQAMEARGREGIRLPRKRR